MADDTEKPQGVLSGIFDLLKQIPEGLKEAAGIPGKTVQKTLGMAKDVLGEPLMEAIVGGALGASGVAYGPANKNAEPFWANRQREHQRRALQGMLGVDIPTGIDPADFLAVYKAQQPDIITTPGGLVQVPPVLPPAMTPPALQSGQLSPEQAQAVGIPAKIPTPPAPPRYLLDAAGKPIGAKPTAPKFLSSANAIRTAYLLDPTNPQNIAAMEALKQTEALHPPKPPKEPETVVDKPNVTWFYPDGRVVANEDGPISPVDARTRGARPVPQKVSDEITSAQQSLVMLKNMADVVDRLHDNGKLLQARGLAALWDRVNKKWLGISGDPDLAELQGYGSDMIIIARNLGEKGVRAIQAYEGMLSLLGTGKAPYEAIKNYLQKNLDTALRAGVPKLVPGAYDTFPGARNMGKKNTLTPQQQQMLTP